MTFRLRSVKRSYMASPPPVHNTVSMTTNLPKIAAVLGLGVLVGPVPAVEPAIQLNTVPVPLKSYRLLAMTMDDDGFIWTGSIHRAIHRYDPRTAAVETVKLPYDSSASSCIC